VAIKGETFHKPKNGESNLKIKVRTKPKRYFNTPTKTSTIFFLIKVLINNNHTLQFE
jgi:hypothetical protein